MTPIYLETWGIAPTGATRRFDLRGIHVGAKVAIHAPNGSGKSMLLGSFGGILYGRIDGYNGGSAFKECVVGDEGGGQLWFTMGPDLYRARRQVSGARHTAYLHRVKSAPEPLDFRVGDAGLVELVGAEYEPIPSDAGGLLSEFSDALSGIGVMDEDLWAVGPFAHQKGLGDFWGLKTVSARRTILAKMMGAHRFEGLSQRARDQRKALDKVVKVIADDVGRLEAREEEAAGLRGEAQGQRIEATEMARCHEASASTLDLHRQTEAAIREKLRGLEEEGRTLEREGATVSEQLEEATARLRAIDDEVAQIEEAVADLDGLRARAAEAAELHEQCARLQADHRVAVAEVQAAQAKVADLDAQLAELPEVPEDLEERRAELVAVTVGAESVEIQQAQLLEIRAELVEELEAIAVSEHETRAADAERDRAAADVARLEKAAGLVDEVPCQGRAWNLHQYESDNRLDCSKCSLLAEAKHASVDLRAARANLEEVEVTVGGLKLQAEEAAAIEKRIAAVDADLDPVNAQAAAIEAARADLEDLDKVAAVAEKRTALALRLAGASDLMTAAAEKKRQISKAGGEAERALEALAEHRLPSTQVAAHPLAQLEKATGAAQAIERLQGERITVAAKVESLRERAAEIAYEMTGHSAALDEVVADLATQAQATQAAAEAHQAAETALADARRTLDRLEGHLAALEEDLAQLPALRALLADATQMRDDERLIEEGFSVKGVQGLLVDLAGPAFSERMNRLLCTLADAIGEQPWEVKLDTYDPDAPPTKRERADLLVKAPGETSFRPPRVSPGQQGPLSLAMRGASILTMEEEHGIEVPLCIADELDGPLDDGRRRGFIPMLNACGARTWLVISHHEDVRAQCDHLFEVGDGFEGGVRRVR